MTIFNGTVGNNTFVGSAADDIFNYGNVTYSGATITAGRGLDTITANGGSDTLNFGNVGIDHIFGTREGNDYTFYLQPGTDWTDANAVTTLGGVRVTNFFAADGTGVVDRIDAADGHALFSFTNGVLRVQVYNTSNVLMFGNIEGWDANDSLVGTAADDYIGGKLGNDTLSGGSGNDEMEGGAGNDVLNGGAGNDTIRGDDGVDTVTAAGANGNVKIDLAANTLTQLTATNVGADSLTSIENAVGGNYDDQLYGNGAANVLNGGAGNDALYGLGGNDSLVGGTGGDYFDASATSTTAGPGAGNDTIDGGAVVDLVNYIDGNTIGYANSGAAVVVNLATGVATDGGGGTDKLININFVRGSSFGDTLTGKSGVNSGFEQFWGNGGNDTINGGTIVDTLNGTDGNRAAFDQLSLAVTVDLLAGTAIGQGNDVLININQVRGSTLADKIYGSNRTDITETIEGRGGNDLLDGRGGLDFVRYQYATGAVNVNLATGVGNAGTGDVDTLSNFEGIRGSNFGDTLTGGNAANAALEFFRGMGGNDTIDGGAGYDRVDYVDSVKAVSVTLGGASAGTAQDGQAILGGQVVAAGTVGATYGVDTLLNIEAVRGSDFNDTLTGSNIATQETFEGRKGNDVIDGNGGLDRAGYLQGLAAVTVTLGSSGADGTASDGFGTTDILRDIENVQGTRDFGDKLTGNELANVLDGQGGNDTLTGSNGDDSLLGGAGNDLMIGGNGKDVLTGSTGMDLFRFVGTLTSTNVDRITDFVVADDTMQLDDAYFAGIGPVGALSAAAFHVGTAAADTSDRIVYNSATGALYFDADGSGAGAQVQFATIGTGLALSATDFVIV